MPKAPNHDEQTIAAAFILLHGNPPKAIRYHRGMFAFRSPAAHDYKKQLQHYIWKHLPSACKTRKGEYSTALAEQARNRCLRYIMGVAGKTSGIEYAAA